MPLVDKNGNEFQISTLNTEQFINKADILHAFDGIGSQDKMKFRKKGSEIKMGLGFKKSEYKGKIKRAMHQLHELKEELHEQEVPFSTGTDGYCVFDMTNATDEQKRMIVQYNSYKWAIKSMKAEYNIICTMMANIEDNKSYELTLSQLSAISTPDPSTKVMDYEEDEDEMEKADKVAKVMREFKEGKLTSHGKKVTDRKQAVAIAMSEAGLSKSSMYKGMSLDEMIDEHKRLVKVLESVDKEDDKKELEIQRKELEELIAQKKNEGSGDEMEKAFSDLFEKATYKDNPGNRKLGRVGRKYGGQRKEAPIEVRSGGEEYNLGKVKRESKQDTRSRASAEGRNEKVEGMGKEVASETPHKMLANRRVRQSNYFPDNYKMPAKDMITKLKESGNKYLQDAGEMLKTIYQDGVKTFTSGILNKIFTGKFGQMVYDYLTGKKMKMQKGHDEELEKDMENSLITLATLFYYKAVSELISE